MTTVKKAHARLAATENLQQFKLIVERSTSYKERSRIYKQAKQQLTPVIYNEFLSWLVTYLEINTQILAIKSIYDKPALFRIKRKSSNIDWLKYNKDRFNQLKDVA
jgi:hypothetical protein